MAQRKPSRSSSTKRSTRAGKPNADRIGGAAGNTLPGRKRAGKPGRSIVNQKRTPWGLILTVGLVVLFAAGVIGYALTRHSSNATKTPFLTELAAAKQIGAITFAAEPERNHVSTAVKYSASPPVGGNHAPVWADCSGTVYSNPIADENAMHSFEHGAVWITYQPGLPPTQITPLAELVTGQNYTFMSPYPGQKSRISIQSWGYQVSVDSATDPRVAQFVGTLRNNPKTTPEPGASCANPAFKSNPSAPGRPAES